MSKYTYPDTVLIGRNAANARDPRLQSSAINEFCEMLSDEVAAGKWLLDRGTPINGTGQDVEQYLDALVSTRPHWEVPADVVDEADETWTSGSLSKQGARWKKLRAHLGSDAATDAAMAAEAAVYGVKPGITQKGVKPGEKSEDDTVKTKGSNPWDVEGWARSGKSEAARLAKIASLIRLGTEVASSIASSANPPRSITGALLKR